MRGVFESAYSNPYSNQYSNPVLGIGTPQAGIGTGLLPLCPTNKPRQL